MFTAFFKQEYCYFINQVGNAFEHRTLQKYKKSRRYWNKNSYWEGLKEALLVSRLYGTMGKFLMACQNTIKCVVFYMKLQG